MCGTDVEWGLSVGTDGERVLCVGEQMVKGRWAGKVGGGKRWWWEMWVVYLGVR